MKNVNKNNLRFLLTGITIGGLIFGGIGVVAVNLTAKEIKYTPSNEKFTATNAEEALNEIYKIAEYEIPEDTYFYEEGTEGNSSTIVRYKKINNEYFVCDANGLVAEGTAATDVSSKTLISYVATSSSNLSANTAGYASNKLYLGDGSDNAAYMQSGMDIIVAAVNEKLGTSFTKYDNPNNIANAIINMNIAVPHSVRAVATLSISAKDSDSETLGVQLYIDNKLVDTKTTGLYADEGKSYSVGSSTHNIN